MENGHEHFKSDGLKLLTKVQRVVVNVPKVTICILRVKCVATSIGFVHRFVWWDV